MDTSESFQEYIVLLKDDVIMNDHFLKFAGEHNTDANMPGHEVLYSWTPDFANAYLGKFSPRALEQLATHQNVDSITPNYEDEEHNITEQNDAGWNLARIQQKGKITGKKAGDLDYKYKYDLNHEAGAGVDIYIIDSGIYLDHADFGGRATWGTSIQENTTKNPVTDDDVYREKKPHGGHGTHVAGIAAGKRWGVAKAANLIAVKIEDDAGNSRLADYLKAIQWVLEAVAEKKTTPAVVNVSRGFPHYIRLLDKSIVELVNAGIHVVVSAGNRNWDAKNTSPANAPLITCVGATDIQDNRWISQHTDKDGNVFYTGSNYGGCVDFFAPGQDITSCGLVNKDKKRDPNATIVRTGTSMSAPLVAGIIATFISLHGNLPPIIMTNVLKTLSVKDILNLKGTLDKAPEHTLNALVRGALHVPANFQFKSDDVALTTYNPAILSKDSITPLQEKHILSFTTTQLECKKSETQISIPFYVISAHPFVDIGIYRAGTSKSSKKDDQAVFTYDNGTYTDGEFNESDIYHEVVFKYCLLEKK